MTLKMTNRIKTYIRRNLKVIINNFRKSLSTKKNRNLKVIMNNSRNSLSAKKNRNLKVIMSNLMRSLSLKNNHLTKFQENSSNLKKKFKNQASRTRTKICSSQMTITLELKSSYK